MFALNQAEKLHIYTNESTKWIHFYLFTLSSIILLRLHVIDNSEISKTEIYMYLVCVVWTQLNSYLNILGESFVGKLLVFLVLFFLIENSSLVLASYRITQRLKSSASQFVNKSRSALFVKCGIII